MAVWNYSGATFPPKEGGHGEDEIVETHQFSGNPAKKLDFSEWSIQAYFFQ